MLALLALPTLLYERSHGLESGDYAEAVSFCEALAKDPAHARVIRYGTTPEGRPMVALLVSRAGDLTPQALARSARPLLFVNNGIHAGEIEGKDASLLLMRGMLREGEHPDLFAGANWLVVPVYNVDGHERRSPYGRINQNGPKAMGWRATAQNYNLNRDFMKADAPETRAWLGLVHRYRPDFLFDDHTTDGADYRYAVLLSVPYGPTLPPRTASFDQALYEAVRKRNDARGVLTGPYFELRDPAHPERGLTVEDFTPRYTHGYLGALGRPAMLVETHVLKDYRTRVGATATTLVNAATVLVQETARLKAMNRAADVPPREGETVVLDSKPETSTRPFTFLGWRYAPRFSVAAGGETADWVHEPVSTPTTVQDAYAPDARANAPAGYAVPAAWTDAIARLRFHGLPVRILGRPLTGDFSTDRFEEVRFPSRPFEGRFMPTFNAVPTMERRTLPVGTAVVPVSRLAMQLLEPNAPDSLVRWGLFNNVFETKEYFEDYAMAPVGDAMLARDPKLKAEFEAWLAAHPDARVRQRLAWLYERSPYRDARLNAYPVVRLSGRQMRGL